MKYPQIGDKEIVNKTFGVEYWRKGTRYYTNPITKTRLTNVQFYWYQRGLEEYNIGLIIESR